MSHRREPRLDVQHPAAVLYEGSRYPGCQIVNFSEGGLFVEWGDSDLGERLERGVLDVSKHKKARIELQGTQLAVVVELVYVTQLGLSVAFSEPAQPVFDYLNEYRQAAAASAEAAAASSGPGSATHSILERLSEKALGFLRKQYVRFPPLAREDLISSTDEGLDSGTQTDLFFASTTLEQQQEQVRRQFFERVASAFKELSTNVKPVAMEAAGTQRQPVSELALVDKEDFDEWILLNTITHRLDAQLAEPIYKLNLALSHLLQKPVKIETNPLSPLSLLLAIKEPLDALNFAQEARRIVYEAFSKALFSAIHRLYGELLACLAEEGIDTGTHDELPQAAASNPGRGDEQYPAQHTLEDLSTLLDASRGKTDEVVEASSDHPVVPREQAIEFIDSLPLRAGQSILRQLEQFLLSNAEQPASLDPTTRASIGVSQELLEAVQQDEVLCGGVQQLLNRLEVPFIKEAITDPALLEKADHPGRLFLEAVEGLAPYCNTQRDGVDAGRLGELVGRIEDGTLSTIGQVTRQIETLQDQYKEHFERNRSLAIDSCKRNEKLRQAHLLVKTTLQELLGGESISFALDRLFHYGWVNLLIHTAVLHQQDSAQWKAYLRVIHILRKLFSADQPFTVLSVKNASDLLTIIRKGLADYPVHPDGAQQYTTQLHFALTEGGERAQSLIENRVQVDEAYLKRLFVGQILADATADPAAQPGKEWLDLVSQLALDEWLVERREDGQMRLLNLAWINPQSGRYLLVDGNGIKVKEAEAGQLAGLFESNTYARLENQRLQVIDRAIQRILQKGYDNVQQDISQDELTGVMNRRAFVRRLNETLQARAMEPGAHALIMLDVDQFGLVNDLCGYEGGDKLLQAITNIIRTYLPEDSHFARTGDDEFTLLVRQNSLDQGYQLAETNRLAIHEFRYSWDNQVIPVSVSVGVVAVTSRDQTSADLLKAASSACGIAKQAGRNCTRIYRETDTDVIEHKRMIQSVAVIEDALENDHIRLAAQIIEPLQEGQEGVAHYEVLMRILGEDGELQSPFHFITAAEHYELMRDVDRWVVNNFFDMAEQQLHNLEQFGGFSINLSGQSLADKDFKAFLKQRIQASPIPHEKLGFEITETVMVKDTQDTINFINEIRETGCSFYLDDFGSGYASFYHLKDLPVDFVKIDGLFIRDLLEDHTSRTMVRSVTEIAHFMGKQVIAEFVENQETAEALRQIGVDYIQGYHVGRPSPLLELLVGEQTCANVG